MPNKAGKARVPKSRSKRAKRTRRSQTKSGKSKPSKGGVVAVRRVAKAAPAAVGSRLTKYPSAAAHINGTLVLAEIAQSSISNSTFNIAAVNLNPFLFGLFVGGTGNAVGGITTNRMTAMAQCFNRFRVKQLRMRYIPACSSTTAGMIMLSYNENPNMAMAALLQGSGNTTTSNASIATQYQIYSNLPSVEHNVWMSNQWIIPCDKSWHQTDPFQAVGLYSMEASAGVVNILMHDVPTGSLTYGTYHLDYDLEFCDPTWAPSYSSIGNILMPTFTVNSQTSATDVTISYDGITGGSYAGFFTGPFIFLPSTTVTFAGGYLIQGQPYIAQVYNPPSYPTTNQFVIADSLDDLNANNFIQCTGSFTGGNFTASVLALSSFGA